MKQLFHSLFVAFAAATVFGSTGGLGIVTSVAETGSGSASWTVPGSGGLDGVSRVAAGHDNVINRPAYGEAYGAETVSATLDGKPVSVDYDTSEGGSTWRADLDLSSGSHTLLVSAVDSTGTYFGYATNTFTVTNTAYDTITNTYDSNGNVTVRAWVSVIGGTNVTNRLETLTWDAFDRLIAVTNRDTTMSNGFNWVATYDGFGRRIYTGYTMVVSNVPIVDPPDAESVITSMYDPQVEFLETAVNVDGVTTTKTYGPDASGKYGGMQGMGGLEAVQVAGTVGTGVVQDLFGNIIGSISNSAVAWNPVRFSSYGPVAGYQSPALSTDTTVAQTLGWRGRRVDETGLIYLGARHYDPVAGRFISADPMGHGASQDLYSFCGGDPVNRFDPTGRYGKQTGDLTSYDTVPDMSSAINVQDYVEEMHNQAIYNEVGAFVVNLATFGIADPALDLLTGYGFNGEHVDKSIAAENLYIAYMLLLPSMIPFASEAIAGLEAGRLATQVGEEAILEAGEQGLVENAAEQMGSSFAEEDLSGQLTTLETEAAETTTGGIGPVLQGQAGVDRAIAQIQAEGGQVLGTEITVDAGGVRTRPDLFVQNADGSYSFVEVKNGPNAGLTPNQTIGYPAIRAGGAVPAGANAANTGVLIPGVPLGPTPVRLITYP